MGFCKGPLQQMENRRNAREPSPNASRSLARRYGSALARGLLHIRKQKGSVLHVVEGSIPDAA